MFHPRHLARVFFRLHLANSTKLCYTYDTLNRVTKRVFSNPPLIFYNPDSFCQGFLLQ